MESFVLKGNVVHSLADGRLSATKGYVVCTCGTSRGVFATLPTEYSHLPVVDHGERLIVPGLVDLHIHAPQFALRGTRMDLELIDWLNTTTFPQEARFADTTYAQKAYGQFVSTLRKSATTRACVWGTCHTDSTLLLMHALEQSGLVTLVGRVNMDRFAPAPLVEETQRSISETLRWLSACHFERTHPILTPRFVPSCTDALMCALDTVRQDYRLPVQSHLSENMGEIEWVRSLRPDTAFYGQAYHKHHLFGKDSEGGTFPTVMAHCIHSNRQEVALMVENGVTVAHCPASNANLSSGIAPIRHYLNQGVSVGLGTDVAAGESESMFRAVVQCVQMSKLYWRLVDSTAAPLTFADAFRLATRSGGAFFGKVGAFDEGFAFDALVLDDSHLPTPEPLSAVERLERFAYLGGDTSGGIVAKYVEGTRLF